MVLAIQCFLLFCRVQPEVGFLDLFGFHQIAPKEYYTRR